jgi:type II secretory ATPase GspE/PulE/Tfp pilus assembly ATPase PilB-like protein
VHTNDSVGAITRLIDMGVEPYLIASSLRMVIAQRLVRKIDPASQELSGRIGIFESISINEDIKEQIHNKGTENEIKNIAFNDNNTLELDGREKVNLGLTTEDELRRVLQEKN